MAYIFSYSVDFFLLLIAYLLCFEELTKVNIMHFIHFAQSLSCLNILASLQCPTLISTFYTFSEHLLEFTFLSTLNYINKSFSRDFFNPYTDESAFTLGAHLQLILLFFQSQFQYNISYRAWAFLHVISSTLL